MFTVSGKGFVLSFRHHDIANVEVSCMNHSSITSSPRVLVSLHHWTSILQLHPISPPLPLLKIQGLFPLGILYPYYVFLYPARERDYFMSALILLTSLNLILFRSIHVVSRFYLFIQVSNIPLCRYTVASLCTRLSLDSWVVSRLGLL